MIGGILLIRWGVINIRKCEKSDPLTNSANNQSNNSSNNTQSEDPSTTTTTSTTVPKTSKTTTKVKDNNNPGITSKGYTLEKINGAYYVDGYLLVNKTYALDSSWVPSNTHTKISAEICKTCIDEEAYTEWNKMKSDATAIGLNIYIASGYRSYSYQDGLYQSYVNKDGKTAADTYSARAGHSEHQSGLAFDLNSVSSAFAATDEGKWVQDNAYLYGFIIRYPKDKSDETGYKYESWHLRYVGLDLASKLYNNGDWITMETYFGIDSKYS